MARNHQMNQDTLIKILDYISGYVCHFKAYIVVLVLLTLEQKNHYNCGSNKDFKGNQIKHKCLPYKTVTI